MRGNEHVKRAEDLTQNYGTMSDLGLAASRAQVYATLAVAEEQRLANLIAYHSSQLAALGQLSQGVKDLAEGLDRHNAAQVARTQETLETVSEAVNEAQAVTEKLNVEIRARLGLA